MKKSDRLKIVILGITGLLILIGTGIFIFIGQSICTMAGVGLFVIVCLGMVVVAGKKDDQTETIEEWAVGKTEVYIVWRRNGHQQPFLDDMSLVLNP